MSRLLAILSVAAYLTSWWAPVVETQGDLLSGRSRGWQAFMFAMSPLFGSGLDAGIVPAALMVLSALTNVVYFGAMGRAYLRPAADRRAFGWALAGASLLNAVWPTYFDMGADLRIGFYLWWAAFPIGAATLLWRRG